MSEGMTAEKLREAADAVEHRGGDGEQRRANWALADELNAWADAIDAVRTAIRDEGPRPKWHRAMMERHRREWPTLWAALDALLAEPT